MKFNVIIRQLTHKHLNEQLANMLTKYVKGPRIKCICSKLGAYDP